MNYKDHVIERLKKYKETDIVITDHARIQALIRGISEQEVKDNILNPKRLVFAGRQEAERENEEKFDCYFIYSNTQAHRYVVVFDKRLIVCTVIKINRRWQRIVEKYERI